MFNEINDYILLVDGLELSGDDLDLILGGSGPSGAQPEQKADSGGSQMSVPPAPPHQPPPIAETFASSTEAFNAQQAAQQKYDAAVQSTLESAGNMALGDATRHANEAYNAHNELQGATTNLEHAVDQDMANYTYYDAVNHQTEAGQGYTPADANMTSSSGLPSVGY
jgi:hypothetical protein